MHRAVALVVVTFSIACAPPPKAAPRSPPPPRAVAPPEPTEPLVAVAVGRSANVAPSGCDIAGWELEDRRFFDVDAPRGLELRGVVGLHEGKGALRIHCKAGKDRVVPIAVSAGIACTSRPVRRGEEETLPTPKDITGYDVLGSSARIVSMPTPSMGLLAKAEASGSTLVTITDASGAARCTRIETDLAAPPAVVPSATPPPAPLPALSLAVAEHAPLVAGCDVVGWESDDASIVGFESNAPLELRHVFGVRPGTTNVTVRCRGGGKRIAPVTVTSGVACASIPLRQGEVWSLDVKGSGTREYKTVGPNVDVVSSTDGARLVVSGRRAGASFLTTFDSQHAPHCTRFDVSAERARCPNTTSLRPEETRSNDAAGVVQYSVALDASSVQLTADKRGALVAKGRRAGHAIVWMLDKAKHESCWGLDVEP